MNFQRIFFIGARNQYLAPNVIYRLIAKKQTPQPTVIQFFLTAF